MEPVAVGNGTQAGLEPPTPRLASQHLPYGATRAPLKEDYCSENKS